MAAPKGNKFAKGNKGGNPGYGKMSFITDNANKILPEWWKLANKWLKSKNEKLQQVAFQELNKIQVKMIPQDLTTGGLPFKQTSDDDLKNNLADKIALLLKK